MRRLRASGKPVYALSNFAHETFALAEREYDFLSEFDDRVISGHVGVVKPDPRIYEILFKRVGQRPGELLFIDDSPANVRAAEALGMATIHFHPGVDLEQRTHDPRRPALSGSGRPGASPGARTFSNKCFRKSKSRVSLPSWANSSGSNAPARKTHLPAMTGEDRQKSP